MGGGRRGDTPDEGCSLSWLTDGRQIASVGPAAGRTLFAVVVVVVVVVVVAVGCAKSSSLRYR